MQKAIDGKRLFESNATSIPGYVKVPRIEEAFEAYDCRQLPLIRFLIFCAMI